MLIGDLSGILAMLGSEASPTARLSLLESLPAAAAAAKQHVARSRPAMATLNAWAGMWAAGPDMDFTSLGALVKASPFIYQHPYERVVHFVGTCACSRTPGCSVPGVLPSGRCVHEAVLRALYRMS